MAVELILSTDTLETGFRHKANDSFGAIIVSATPVVVSGVFTGIIRLNCFDGSFISLDLTSLYYTQTQITQLLTGITSSLYQGDWNNSLPGGYAVKSVVSYLGNFWRSNITDNIDIPGATANWTALIDFSQSFIQFTIPSGHDIPYVKDMTAFPQYGTDPTVICKILKTVDGVVTDDKVKALQPNMNIDFAYTDNTYSTLQQIRIFGNMNDSGKFNEDTYVTIKI